MPTQFPVRSLAAVAGALLLILSPRMLQADSFSQTNLVSNVPGLAATTDPNLINPWGVSFSATSPFWVSDQGTGVATLYDGAGNPTALVVTVPGSGIPAGPTGQVFNSTTGFVLPGGTASHFIFDTLNGTIAAWASGTAATTVATTPGAVYTGLALASSGGNNYLYAANSAGAGSINVFSSSFAPATLPGNFVDPNLPVGYVPFNIQLIGSSLYVTYARLGPGGVPISGSTGYVDVFNTNGVFVQRLVSGGDLFAPWGITVAPSGFGSLGNDFLIGNFGNGEIDAYTSTGAFVETLNGSNGLPIVDPNLWALDFRTGGTNVNPNALYFTAGIDNQQGGLFGDIVPTPEPQPFLLVGLGLATLTLIHLRPSKA